MEDYILLGKRRGFCFGHLLRELINSARRNGLKVNKSDWIKKVVWYPNNFCELFMEAGVFAANDNVTSIMGEISRNNFSTSEPLTVEEEGSLRRAVRSDIASFYAEVSNIEKED